MMATSTDMKIWTKQSDFLLQVPDFMEKNDFRDPFVFWNEEIEKYVMLLAARHKTGAVDRRGYTAYAVSDDLWNWEVKCYSHRFLSESYRACQSMNRRL